MLFRHSFMTLLLLAAVLPLAGCGNPDPSWDSAPKLHGPYEVDGAVAWYDELRGALLVVRSTEKGVVHERIALTLTPHAPGQVTADGQRLVLLDLKHRGLWVVTPKQKTAIRHQLPSQFSGITLAADGKAAVAFHAGGGAAATSLVDVAEVALIDLTAAQSSVRSVSIDGLSRAPLAVRIAPEVTAGGGTHRVVWIEAVSLLGIADFGPPKPDGTVTPARTTVVPLVADPKVFLTPRKTVTRTDGGSLHLYLIAHNSDDVVHVALDLVPTAISATLDQIASGKNPTDLALIQAKDGLRILTAHSGTLSLGLLDPTNGSALHIGLEGLATAIVPYIVPYADATDRPMALLWHPFSPNLFLVDIDGLPKKKGKAVQRVVSDQAISGLAQQGTRFLLHHPNSNAGLSAFDAASVKLTAPQTGTGKVQAARTVGDDVFALGEIDGGLALVKVSMTGPARASIRLNQQATQLVRIGDKGVALVGQGLGGPWLATFHKGLLTWAEVRWVEGFALTGTLTGTLEEAP